ncbi:hypothetical protein ACFWPX_17145 [Nocardia sp. NPDC058518]|uniref:hypothetical protein n=1 Tax=Nocardia sp. NPDC058518 TaxID=3346534 RepID=UPI00365C0024
MDWTIAVAMVGVPTTLAALVRGSMFFYALRGTHPQDRPAIIRALGRMHKDARVELPAVGRRMMTTPASGVPDSIGDPR